MAAANLQPLKEHPALTRPHTLELSFSAGCRWLINLKNSSAWTQQLNHTCHLNSPAAGHPWHITSPEILNAYQLFSVPKCLVYFRSVIPTLEF